MGVNTAAMLDGLEIYAQGNAETRVGTRIALTSPTTASKAALISTMESDVLHLATRSAQIRYVMTMDTAQTGVWMVSLATYVMLPVMKYA